MANRAGGRESRRDVIRVVGSRVLGLMAAIAVGGNRSVVVLEMTIRARHRGMRPRQREDGVVVIERRRAPGGGAMAHVALLREVYRRVVRIVRCRIVSQVARYAGGVGEVVI